MSLRITRQTDFGLITLIKISSTKLIDIDNHSIIHITIKRDNETGEWNEPELFMGSSRKSATLVDDNDVDELSLIIKIFKGLLRLSDKWKANGMSKFLENLGNLQAGDTDWDSLINLSKTTRQPTRNPKPRGRRS